MHLYSSAFLYTVIAAVPVNAVQQFMRGKPEPVVELTTGQGFFYKK